jgi:hypothetical protein
MESSASAHRVSRSDSTVKIVNSFRDLLVSVLGILSTPLTIAVVVLVALAAFNSYERWSHRDLAPKRAHELALTRTREMSAIEVQVVNACRTRSVPLWTCVGQTRRQLK